MNINKVIDDIQNYSLINKDIELASFKGNNTYSFYTKITNVSCNIIQDYSEYHYTLHIIFKYRPMLGSISATKDLKLNDSFVDSEGSFNITGIFKNYNDTGKEEFLTQLLYSEIQSSVLAKMIVENTEKNTPKRIRRRSVFATNIYTNEQSVI